MAYNFSRRDFMKCAGVTVLAVAAGGLLTGCGGGVDDGNSYGQNVPTTVGGVKVKLLGYEQDPIAGMVGNYNNKTMIQICIGIENTSEEAIRMGNTTADKLTDVIKAIYNNDYSKLAESDFAITDSNGLTIYHADIGYRTSASGTIDFGVLGELEPGKTGCIKAFAIVPSNWEQLKIKYTPYFAKNEARVFVLKRANKI